MENIKQYDTLVLEVAIKAYIQRLLLIWSSPLSDYNKMVTTKQFAMSALSYLMTTLCSVADYGIRKVRQRIKNGDFGE